MNIRQVLLSRRGLPGEKGTREGGEKGTGGPVTRYAMRMYKYCLYVLVAIAGGGQRQSLESVESSQSRRVESSKWAEAEDLFVLHQSCQTQRGFNEQFLNYDEGLHRTGLQLRHHLGLLIKTYVAHAASTEYMYLNNNSSRWGYGQTVQCRRKRNLQLGRYKKWLAAWYNNCTQYAARLSTVVRRYSVLCLIQTCKLQTAHIANRDCPFCTVHKPMSMEKGEVP